MLDGVESRRRAVAALEESFRSLGPGKLQDLVGVTLALLVEEGRPRGTAKHLCVEVVRGRVRGDIDYQASPWRHPRRSAQLTKVVAALRERASVVRNCGMNESRTGVWFDLGPV
jgi:hypothetical protein